MRLGPGGWILVLCSAVCVGLPPMNRTHERSLRIPWFRAVDGRVK